MSVPELLRKELNAELTNILDYWVENTVDQENGGFYGRIDHFNNVYPKASKGVILNTRILWSFSAASTQLKKDASKALADRAYNYLLEHFIDKEYGGVFWELDYQGNVLNARKQIYAQAFAVYSFAEYHTASGDEGAKKLAIEIFELIEKHAKDSVNGGYLEAFARDWNNLGDMRLSEKDLNAPKTMNTHLHILEAYSSLLRIYPNQKLVKSLQELVVLFLDIFLSDEQHYHLFFSKDWHLESHIISYGHDIEAAWLILEAASLLQNQALIERAKTSALKVANTFLKEALDSDGAVINEKNYGNGITDTDRHWWPQVEALIGLAYAYKIAPNAKYLEASNGIWQFTKKHLLDHENGEWHFRVNNQGLAYTQEDKVSMWKAPYHTTRACIKLNSLYEII